MSVCVIINLSQRGFFLLFLLGAAINTKVLWKIKVLRISDYESSPLKLAETSTFLHLGS